LQRGVLMDIQIKAGSPDNELEIRNIIDLFRSEYKSTFPEQAVYHEAFWARRITTRFSSILAYQDHELVAHLALQPERKRKHCAQITFPAIKSNKISTMQEISKAVLQCLERQAYRHEWYNLYTLLMSHTKHYQKIACEDFKFSESAILPNYFGSGQNAKKAMQTKKRDAIFALRFFDKVTDKKQILETIFVPKKHLDICKYLYSGQNLKNKFKTSSEKNVAVPTDLRACATYRYQGHDFSHVYVTPSLLNNFNSVLHYTDNSNLFFINLYDPKCPDFCDYLEDLGLSFCGVIPLTFKSKEYIVYSKINTLNITQEDCYSERAKLLVQYITDTIPLESSQIVTVHSQREAEHF